MVESFLKSFSSLLFSLFIHVLLIYRLLQSLIFSVFNTQFSETIYRLSQSLTSCYIPKAYNISTLKQNHL